jgi:hypothetical protein
MADMADTADRTPSTFAVLRQQTEVKKKEKVRDASAFGQIQVRPARIVQLRSRIDVHGVRRLGRELMFMQQPVSCESCYDGKERKRKKPS